MTAGTLASVSDPVCPDSGQTIGRSDGPDAARAPGPHFRAGVIMAVRRGTDEVLAFERGDVPGSWQLPQGGIDRGETPEEAAWRELAEETGLGPDQVRLLGDHPRWTVYELPNPNRTDGRLGQAHRWFWFEVVDDAVEPTPDGREFVAWRWMRAGELIDEVVGFRRPGYQEVLGVLVSGSS